jgi:hypothetical protein
VNPSEQAQEFADDHDWGHYSGAVADLADLLREVRAEGWRAGLLAARETILATDTRGASLPAVLDIIVVRLRMLAADGEPEP